MTEMVTIDPNKLKEEDRRFLLNRNLNETISSHQGSMSNTTMTLSLLALAIAGFSIIYQTKVIWIILVYCVFSVIGLFFYFYKYKKAQNTLKLERMKLKLNYDELFKRHFAYATKRIE